MKITLQMIGRKPTQMGFGLFDLLHCTFIIDVRSSADFVKSKEISQIDSVNSLQNVPMNTFISG